MDEGLGSERTSRIFIQGLPSYLEENRLREHFAEKGEVTDVKIVRTSDGRSRQFGFIGFRDEQQAEDAITYFNNSYIDTSRLSIKFAEKTNSSKLGRPWSKHSQGSSAYAKRHREDPINNPNDEKSKSKKQKRAKANTAAEANDDPELAEFLQVMQPRQKAATWANDAQAPKPAKRAPKQSSAPNTQSDNSEAAAKENGGKSLSKKAKKARKAQSEDSEAVESGAEQDSQDEEALLAAEQNSNGRLFLRNLSYQATEADLTALLETYGDLSEVHLVIDRSTQRSKGFALVQFVASQDAEAAQAALDGSIFQGRLLHILPAEPPRDNRRGEEPGSDHEDPEEQSPGQASGREGRKNFQQLKKESQKDNAGNRVAWNSLFMRADTVASAIADFHGVSKSQLLDKEAADLPVRMALGEAHVIALTKANLAEAGVAVEALESAAGAAGKSAKSISGVERSDRVMLVKNLPYTATQEELKGMFGSHGRISRLVLPKTRTLALVEFEAAADARRAFKATAFRRFQNVTLFLEWAPKHIFRTTRPLDKGKSAEEPLEEPPLPAATDMTELRGEDTEDIESSSLYVKNLAWSTTEKGLLGHFDGTVSAAGGSIRAVTIAKRKTAEDKALSAGYGFVECSSEAAAKLALRKLQGSMLDGHKLLLQLSIKKGTQLPKNGSKVSQKTKDSTKAQTKLVVRNVAFEATSKDIRALFQPFGQIKSVRLPKKFDKSHRGFAFVDFLSHQEAVNAMGALAGTHLYGRRLVCEWADESTEG